MIQAGGRLHIAEGYLPVSHCVAWSAISGVTLVASWRWMRTRLDLDCERVKLGLAAAGAFAFLLSALKLPSLTGSCSHPTGLGLATLLYGPAVATVLGSLVLLFQAVLLAHGGLTTLGANVFSMAIFGPWVVFAVRRLTRRWLPLWLSVALAAALGDLSTYVCTSLQLGFAFPDLQSGVVSSIQRFLLIFALTQIPLALSDGWLTSLVYSRLQKVTGDEEAT